jgi:hypothetical protein
MLISGFAQTAGGWGEFAEQVEVETARIRYDCHFCLFYSVVFDGRVVENDGVLAFLAELSLAWTHRELFHFVIAQLHLELSPAVFQPNFSSSLLSHIRRNPNLLIFLSPNFDSERILLSASHLLIVEDNRSRVLEAAVDEGLQVDFS